MVGNRGLMMLLLNRVMAGNSSLMMLLLNRVMVGNSSLMMLLLNRVMEDCQIMMENNRDMEDHGPSHLLRGLHLHKKKGGSNGLRIVKIDDAKGENEKLPKNYVIVSIELTVEVGKATENQTSMNLLYRIFEDMNGATEFGWCILIFHRKNLDKCGLDGRKEVKKDPYGE
jgi:hypothetical protein